eukprot:4371002-Alexandrium_andersonii.AAC.1
MTSSTPRRGRTRSSAKASTSPRWSWRWWSSAIATRLGPPAPATCSSTKKPRYDIVRGALSSGRASSRASRASWTRAGR